jgi:ribosome maturation factor RimP
MISADHIRELLEEEITRQDLFLVDVIVRPGNKIGIYVDSMQGVTLETCISVSRFLESRLDRDKEDFELEVSSPGLDRPLKLPVQFIKNIGRTLDVVMKDGIKVSGKLLSIDNDGIITLEAEVTGKNEKGKKKKELVAKQIKQEEIKSAKIVISLKK